MEKKENATNALAPQSPISQNLLPTSYSINSINGTTSTSNRMFKLSPIVQKGLDRECQKTDFNREDNSSIELGCFGKIWRVTHKRTAKTFCIKVFHKQVVKQKKLQEEISSIIETMYSLEHISILRLLNHFEDEENLFLILQNINSEKGSPTLYDQFNFFESEEKVFYLIKQIINVLLFLKEKQLFYSDLKPEMIFIDDNNNIKMTGCGWSYWSNLKSESNIRKNFIAKSDGKNYCYNCYTSPEEIKNETLNFKTYSWKLGILLFELLTRGHEPFVGKSLEELNNNILNLKINWPVMSDNILLSDSSKNLILSLLKLNPNQRLDLSEIFNYSFFSKISLNFDQNQNPPTDECIINKRLSQNTSPQDLLILKLKKENEILKQENESSKKENQVLKSSFTKLESEYKELKSKYQTNQMEISITEGGQGDSFYFLENNKKFEYVNKDRMTKHNELEEKSNEILELRSKVRLLENERELMSINFDEIKEKNYGLEDQVNRLTILLEQEKSEKENKINLLNKKLEMLENKLFNPRGSTQGIKSDNFSQTNEEFMKSISILLYDMLKEFNENIAKVSLRSKEDNENLIKTLKEIILQREINIKESLTKVKEDIQNDFIKNSSSTSLYENSKKSMNDKMDWMKKQISELIPFKLKTMNLEVIVGRLEKENKILNEKFQLTELERNTIKRVLIEKDESIKSMRKYIYEIENKLSDIKDFILKSCPEKMEELFLIYKI
jgi:serine/threonine protein kinase